jgi:hypothetical protein
MFTRPSITHAASAANSHFPGESFEALGPAVTDWSIVTRRKRIGLEPGKSLDSTKRCIPEDGSQKRIDLCTAR